MTDGIEIPVTVEGTEEGAQSVDLLTGALLELGQAQQAAATANDLIAARERGIAQARREYAEQTRAAAAAERAATSEQNAASMAAIQFGQRLAGAANAVQALVGQLGGGSRGAGLIGAIANSTVQFAQLGAALGPHGALVGGIIGALIPAMQGLRQASDDAATAAAALNVDLDTLISRAEAAERNMARLRRLDEGSGTLTEQTAYQQRAQQRVDQYLAALGGDQGAIRALRQRGVTGRADTVGTVDLALEAVGGAPAVRLDDGERQLVQTLLEGAMRDAQRRAELVSGTTDRAVAASQEASDRRAARASRSGSRGDASRAEQAAIQARKQAAWDSSGLTGRENASPVDRERIAQEQMTRAIREQREERDRAAEAAQQAHQQAREAAEEEARQLRELSEERKRVEEEETQRLRERKAAQEQQYQTQVQGYSQVTTTIVSGIVQAGEAIASGAEDAGSAFKKLLAGFLEMIAQRAALSAGTEYAEAIASAARYDWSGFAQHTAAGVAFTGVAVAAGVGAGALNASAAAGAGAGQGAGPARPPGTGQTGGDRGGGTVNIYYNSPVVTAGTYDELGRSIRGMVLTSEGRHPAP